MECKFFTTNEFLKAFLELIDTLWNVNVFDVIKLLFPESELIDTLWNVNIFRD